MMLTLLLYSYSIGVHSSRKIMARCQTDAAFRVIVGNDIPDFRTISDFRELSRSPTNGSTCICQ
jgi:transposase